MDEMRFPPENGRSLLSGTNLAQLRFLRDQLSVEERRLICGRLRRHLTVFETPPQDGPFRLLSPAPEQWRRPTWCKCNPPRKPRRTIRKRWYHEPPPLDYMMAVLLIIFGLFNMVWGVPTNPAGLSGPDPNNLPNLPQVDNPPLPPVPNQATPKPQVDIPRPRDNSLTTFHGYDCTRPSQMKPVQAQKNVECPTEVPKPVKRDPVFMVVLQEAEYQRTFGTRCDYQESRLPYFCGSASHVTIEGDGFRVQEPKALTPSKCLKLAKTGRLKLGWGPRDIPKNVRTQVTYYAAGKTIYDASNHINCQGGLYDHPAEDHPYRHSGVVDLRSADILVQDITLAIADDGTMTEVRDRITLPKSCTVEKEYCFTPTGNYVWNQPRTDAERCKLYKTRGVNGELVTDAEGKQAFVTTDGSALHLLITGKKFKCGQEVMTTNHQKIYLTKDTTVLAFQRPLDSAEMSIATFSSAQIQFSEHTLAKYVEDVMLELQTDRCLGAKNRRTPLELLAAGQTALANGETMSLGNGKFATARGEAYYTYQCAKVKARATSQPKCYDRLPVTIPLADRKAHFQARGETDDGTTNFYLEPKTHILVTDAAPMQCMPQMAPLWQNAAGNWISASPTILAAPAPTPLNTNDPIKADLKLFKGTDYGQGGLYTASQIRTMDKERQLPNRIHDIELSMAGRAGISGWHADALDGSIIADDVLDLSRAWYLTPADWIWARIQEIGHLGSILVAASMIIKLFTWAVGVIMRFHYGEPIGPSRSVRHLAQTLFPSAVLMFDRWEQNRQDNLRIRQRLLAEAEADEIANRGRQQANMLVAGAKVYPALASAPKVVVEDENPYSNGDVAEAKV